MSNGCPLVLMEKVSIDRIHNDNMPEWGLNSDGGQIARSALLQNRWAAYDAAVLLRGSVPHRKVGYYMGGNADYQSLVPDEHRIWLRGDVFPTALLPY